MKRPLGILVVLLLARPALGEVILKNPTPVLGGGLMYIDLIIHDTGTHTETIGAFGARITLGGADAARFTGAVAQVDGGVDKLTAAQMAALVAPASYAWPDFYVKTTVDVGAVGQAWVNFGHIADEEIEHVALNTLNTGDVVGRFCFIDSGGGALITDLTFELTSYGAIDPYAVFTTSGVLPVSGVLIPEPATVALLGFGLFGAFMRRRRQGQ